MPQTGHVTTNLKLSIEELQVVDAALQWYAVTHAAQASGIDSSWVRWINNDPAKCRATADHIRDRIGLKPDMRGANR